MKSKTNLEDEKLRLALFNQLEAEGKRLQMIERHLNEHDTRPLPPLSYKGLHRGSRRIRGLVLVATVVAALLVGTATVAANFEDFYNWFVSYTDNNISLRNVEGKNGIEVDMKGNYLLSPTPEGHQITNTTLDGTIIKVVYTNGETSFTFYQMKCCNGGLQDQEKTDSVTEITVHGQPGILIGEGTEIQLA